MNNVVPPALVPSFLARHRWKSNCRGMALELMAGESFDNRHEEAVALYKRLLADNCDGCSLSAPTTGIEVRAKGRYFLLWLCDSCMSHEPSGFDLRNFEISEHLADVVAGRCATAVIQ